MSLATVVLSFNHPQHTTRCLQSLVSFDCGPIYLVHNGSQVDFVDELKKTFPLVNHLVIKENRGYSGGANFGIGQAFDDGFENVFFLTNDTWLKMLDVDYVLTELRKRPALLGPKIEIRNTGRIDSFGGSVNFKTGRLSHLREVSDEIKKKQFKSYIPGTAFFVNRRAWLRIGSFDEALGTYWEDVDFSLRAQLEGVKVSATDRVTVGHGVGKTCHKDPYYTVFLFHRNRRRVVNRHAQGLERLAFNLIYHSEMVLKIGRLFLKNDKVRLRWAIKSYLDRDL